MDNRTYQALCRIERDLDKMVGTLMDRMDANDRLLVLDEENKIMDLSSAIKFARNKAKLLTYA